MIRLFVGNVPYAASEIELRKHFENHPATQQYPVGFSQIIRDRTSGHSRGFGFIELNAPVEEMRTVCQSLNGSRMMGRVLTVNEATARTPKGAR